MASEKADSAHPEEQPPVNLTNEERLKEAAAHAEKALEAQNMANKLKSAASSLTDPKKREKMMTDAYNKEVEAHGNSKKARLLQSGAFQGSLGGAGIGGAVGAGVGTLVGAVVGTVTAIPTTGLGALAGAGVGAIHGPFIKLGSLASGGKKDANKDGKQEDDKDAKKDGKQEDEKKDRTQQDEKTEPSPDDDDAVPDPAALRQAADLLAAEREKQGKDNEASQQGTGTQNKGRKKPRKIEVRSGNKSQPASS
ncbi:hypothetical protein CC80DRAFT_299652 [Byssothecium circinans]|uniref:Glycine zipper domain-containing protein n=1 Tax=Byssothecium circinans TaxID=147558 RepID=A0A6A5TI94_9PLEO|nr:hypothetical protein CC80DRAFT_299652 [Byssothecium circinans]